MAFDIMSLFGPQAINRLLQPVQNAQGVQQLGPWLVERNRMEAAAQPANDPWAGMRQATVDPMQTAAIPQQPAPMQPQPMQAQAAPQQERKPFFDDERKAMLNDIFTGWAMGSTPGESIAMGAKMVAANRGTRKNVNETVNWLKGRGMDEGQAKMLAGSPPALNEYLKQMMQPPEKVKPIEVNGRLVDPNTFEVIADFSEGPKPTDDMREYETAKSQGFEGSFMDFMIKMKEAGRSQVNIDTGVKLPAGYQWVDPKDQTKGVQPIAGGPATQIPGELAARVGMGENFLKNDLPILRDPSSLEAATGPIDRLQAMVGYGKPAEVERKFQSGVEVLSRLLSGAGMTQVEIDEKTRRYMPTIMDDDKSLLTKLSQLEAEIRAAGDAAMRGRGGSITQQPGQQPGQRLRYNPATGELE